MIIAVVIVFESLNENSWNIHFSLSKEEELLAVASAAAAAASSNNAPPPVLSKRDRILQRHSVEVISTAYLKSKQVYNSSPLDSLEKSAMNANANRNLATQGLDSIEFQQDFRQGFSKNYILLFLQRASIAQSLSLRFPGLLSHSAAAMQLRMEKISKGMFTF